MTIIDRTVAPRVEREPAPPAIAVSPRPLRGAVAVVTGGATGIGAAISLRLAELGASVVVNYLDRGERDAKQMVEELTERNMPATAVQGDVTDPDDVARLVNAGREAFGPVTILVNSAALMSTTKLSEMSVGEWRRVIETNLTGTFQCIQGVLPGMKQAGYGRILNIASVAAITGGTVAAASYVASKGGVVSLTRAVAKDAAPFGVTVNCLAPGMTKSPMNDSWDAAAHEAMLRRVPVGRIGTPEEIAAFTAFMVGPDTGYLTGQTICVDGGETLT